MVKKKLVQQEVCVRINNLVPRGYLYRNVKKSEAKMDNVVGTEPY